MKSIQYLCMWALILNKVHRDCGPIADRRHFDAKKNILRRSHKENFAASSLTSPSRPHSVSSGNTNESSRMSEITEDPGPDPMPSITETVPPRAAVGPTVKVGGFVLPSKTWVPFLAGAVGGMSGAVLTAPLDVVKTRLQSDFYRERLEAAKRAGAVTTRFGVWRHIIETGLIIRYYSNKVHS